MLKALSFTSYDSRTECLMMAAITAERLLSTACVLPEGEYLGWQITVGPGNVCEGVAFSSDRANATEEDLGWIFSSCTKPGKDSTDPDEDLRESFCAGDRKLYLFTEDEECEPEISERGKADFFKEFLSLSDDAGVGIRFVAGPDKDTGKSYGMLMISMAEEITLRMRSLLHMALPFLTISRIDEVPEHPQEEQKLTDGITRACVERTLTALLYEREEERRKSSRVFFTTEDEMFESGEFTSLEVLGLSPRAIGCLSRAGVKSVEKLMELSEEDLRRVRHLNSRCVDEIKEKLAEHTAVVKNVSTTDGKESISALEELVGLKEVKQQVRRILALARMKQKMPEGAEVPIVLNMEFVGNPGTAKTTVARILAGVLADIGILSSREMIEVGRADLVAGYVGQTAEQVKNVFKRAQGKLLFIDEAYAVADHDNGRFGEEAINTLVLEMENHREDTIVVMAGYPDKMEKFFSTNPGLRSRVPFKITFPDYNVDELVQIAQMEARKRAFAISPEAETKVRSCCEAAAGNENAGNGRFCRNLVEDSILNFAERVYSQEEVPANADFALACEDFKIPAVLQEEKEKEERTIGFRCS